MPALPVSSARGSQPDADAHLEAAAAWYVRLCAEDAHAGDRAEWQRWHDSSPEHRSAWSRVERMQGLLRQAPAQSRHALGAVASRKSRRVALWAGLAFLCGLSFLWMQAATEAKVEWLATAPGERRELQLADGTRLLLGSASRVGVSFDAAQRRLILQTGSLQVVSGHDPAHAAAPRPLQVLARDGVVRPLGTRFTLQQDATGTTLAVQEHAVELSQPQGALPPLRLVAGQRVRFSAEARGTPAAAQAGDEAWTRGQLVVLDMPLARFASELAAQSGRPIRCDERIASLRISGSYLVDQPERSLQSIAALHGLRVETGADQALRLVPRRP
ncbi:FecR domain-containing protein [Uliginosibacterium paludis]|uniref:FecR domain-containing protein n=1 Tax=Uliginosibacterium paludis TaxID=1615952 RepID=A0ABV2CU80_9RHOO